jgi:single-strand DNA-binding protein
MSINKVILIGHIGKDPEVKTIGTDNTKVANFSLATSENYTNRNGDKVEHTEWHSIVAWKKLAEVVEKYCRKGTQLYIEGKLKTRKYEKDNITHYTTDIWVETLQMLGQKKQSTTATAADPQPEASFSNQGQEGDDLPF